MIQDVSRLDQYHSSSFKQLPRTKAAEDRNPFDRYCSASWAVEEMLDRVPEIRGSVFECCVGNWDFARPLIDRMKTGRISEVIANDVDPEVAAQYHLDAADPASWLEFPAVDFVITNPPASGPPAPGKKRGTPISHTILVNAYNHARVGVAFYIRKSHSEPCLDRRHWLKAHRHELAYWLPVERFSFTGDGKTDLASYDWFVWIKGHQGKTEVDYICREEA